MKDIIHMRTFNLPKSVQGLIFDMDSTLYRNDSYGHSQITNQIHYLANKYQKNWQDLEKELNDWQVNYALDHQGRKPSFGNTLLGALGISIKESIELRKLTIKPEEYLSKDEQLIQMFQNLDPKLKKVLVTNNPGEIALRTLKVLGVEDFFPEIIGLDRTEKSKPSLEPFHLALRFLNMPAEQVISIGDRYEIDLEVPLQLGCAGILVENMTDIYSLPEILTTH